MSAGSRATSLPDPAEMPIDPPHMPGDPEPDFPQEPDRPEMPSLVPQAPIPAM